jgi:dTDP-4-amino-4,6-dideoxygalactose transaminase
MSISDTVRHSSRQAIFEDYMVGFNYRMTDFQAAVGRKQLERLPELVSRCRGLAARYAELPHDAEGLGLPFEPEWARSNWQIATRRGVMCSHREPPYSDEKRRFSLRQSELAQDHSILLPIHQQMAEEDVVRVAVALRRELRQ